MSNYHDHYHGSELCTDKRCDVRDAAPQGSQKQVLDAMTKPPVEHVITKRNGPGCYIVMCSCGARRQFPRQNALARAAKVRAWIKAHLSSSDRSGQ